MDLGWDLYDNLCISCNQQKRAVKNNPEVKYTAKKQNKKIKTKVNRKVGSYHYISLRTHGKKPEGDAISLCEVQAEWIRN